MRRSRTTSSSASVHRLDRSERCPGGRRRGGGERSPQLRVRTHLHASKRSLNGILSSTRESWTSTTTRSRRTTSATTRPPTPAPSTVQHNRIRASTFDGAFAESIDRPAGRQEQDRGQLRPGDRSVRLAGQRHQRQPRERQRRWRDPALRRRTSTDNTVSDNKVRDNGNNAGDTTDGIRVEAGQVGNVFDGNHLKDNLTHDCHDMNATGNTWTNNRGETSVPPGICGKDDDESSFATSTAFGWDADLPVVCRHGGRGVRLGCGLRDDRYEQPSAGPAAARPGTRGRASPHR